MQAGLDFDSEVSEAQLELIDRKPDDIWNLGSLEADKDGSKTVRDPMDIDFNAVDEMPFEPEVVKLRQEEKTEVSIEEKEFLRKESPDMTQEEMKYFHRLWPFIQAAQDEVLVDALKLKHYTFDMKKVCGQQWTELRPWQRRCALHLLRVFQDRFAETLNELETTT